MITNKIEDLETLARTNTPKFRGILFKIRLNLGRANGYSLKEVEHLYEVATWKLYNRNKCYKPYDTNIDAYATLWVDRFMERYKK